jgi:hypothetical protein
MLERQAATRPTTQERQLLDYVERLWKFRSGRRALHVHLSRLQPHHRRPHHLRIALDTFATLVQPFEGQLFRLANADVVFVCKDVSPAVLDEAVMRLRYLFNEDPVTQATDGPSDEFCTWYDLVRDYDALVQAARGLVAGEQKRAGRIAAMAKSGGSPALLKPLDAHRLGELVDALLRTDLSNVMRRQPVCALLPETPPQPVFRELYISIANLRDTVMPGFDIASDRWLFQHLTQTLDRRMLKLLMKNDDRSIAAAFSLNLNIATVLSPEFAAFDEALRPEARGTIVLELQTIDIFADLGTFVFARDFARDRGYRLCLDGVTEMMLPFIDRQKLGVDFVKLMWQAGLRTRSEARRAEFRAAVERLGATRAILCRCDNEDAVTFGRTLGISLFQGREIAAPPRP